MKAAIIAEGRGDLAVITNILYGLKGIQRSEIQFIRPEFHLDQTDMHTMTAAQFSNWTLVRQECQNPSNIKTFLEIHPEAFVIIHLDTDVRFEPGYEVMLPDKRNSNPEEFCLQLRNNVVDKINRWLDIEIDGTILYAVAIEKTEAWVLTLYEERETSGHNNVKSRLEFIINKKSFGDILKIKDTFKRFDILSSGFRKRKTLFKVKELNQSLKLFCESFSEL